MKYLLILLLLSSCGEKFHLQRMNYHRLKAISLGAKLDSVTTTKTDSAKVAPTELFGNSERVVNEDSVREYCRQLIASEKPELTINPEPVRKDNNTAGKIISRIQKEVCPEVSIDTVYGVPFTIQGETYYVPLKVNITASKGAIIWHVESGSGNIKFIKQEIKTGSVTVGDSTKKNAMDYFFGGLGTLVLFGIFVWFKRG